MKPRADGQVSSHARYRRFVEDYRSRRLGDEGAPGGEHGTAPAPRRRYLHDYLRWLWPHRWSVTSVFLLALLVAGMQMVEPLFTRHIVDRILLNTSIDNATRLVRLNVTGALFAALIVASNLSNAFKDYRSRVVNTRVMLSLRRSLFARLLRLPLPALTKMKTGGILSRLTGDVDTTTGLLQMAIVSPSIAAIRLVVAGAVLFRLNWRLAFLALAIVPGVVVASLIFTRRVRPIYRSMRMDTERIDGHAAETFSGIRVVRAFGREMAELLDYMRGRHTVLRKELFASRREMLIWTSWGLLMGSVNVVIIWYGGYLNLRGGASIGDIMAFQWYTFMLLNPVWTIVNSFSDLQQSLAAMERVFEVLAMPADKPDRPAARDAPPVVQEIRFEAVEFEYRDGCPVILDFDVSIPCGSVVALVGPSGAGKTTVTDLIARLHDPTKGRILLNGTDIRDFRLGTYRDLLAIVQQDVFLFDGSIRDNIAYGRPDATDAEIEAAARNANAHEFITRLPGEYDTRIGEHGAKLSGGQQQRISIARAFLRSPQILILDEATSSLDHESEDHIHASISELFAGRTLFAIAHRLSTVYRADLILLMKDGRIVERGSHNELMSARGPYYEMVIRQQETGAPMLDGSVTESSGALAPV